MARYYVTVADSMTQAVNTYVALNTLPDGSTLSSIKVPPNSTKISVIGTAVTHDGAATVDTGNNFTLQFSGTGMVDGIQELYAGTLMSQETGASVTGTLTQQPAFYRPVDLKVKPGEITIAAAMDGTDCGSPFVVVTVGFE
jgi:hypothetical protein